MLVTEDPVKVDWAQINIVFAGSWQDLHGQTLRYFN